MNLPAGIHPEEPGAVALLDRAIHALTVALDDMPISDVVNLKAKIATIETATKQLGMSNDAKELATEAVRRAEWALGRAVRRGQADGSIARQGHALSTVQHVEDWSPLPTPTDFATKGELYGARGEGLLGIADAAPTPDEFDAALDEAKAEGNLSRANVARKAREKSGSTPAPAATSAEERAHQEAELINAFASIVRRSLTPKNVATLTPKARARLISILNDALNTLQETSL